MVFPKVDDCVALSGAKRDLLHEFDHVLRDVLAATQRAARTLDPADEETKTACVTVMMSVVAGAALSAAETPADVTDEKFYAIARDALAWARHKAGGVSDREKLRSQWLWSLFWPGASHQAGPQRTRRNEVNNSAKPRMRRKMSPDRAIGEQPGGMD